MENFVANIQWGKGHQEFFIFMVYEREKKNDQFYYSGNAFYIKDQKSRPKEEDMPIFTFSFHRAYNNWQSVSDIKVKAVDKNLELLLQGFFPELIEGFRGKESLID
jgi:hypothetical protein